MNYDAETFEERFESPEQAAIAYELLSDELRGECSFVPKWVPGKQALKGCL
jgi:hypothetical protein